MKVIIAGSREFKNYELLTATMEGLRLPITEIVSGHARGADRLGERFAKEKGLPVTLFIPSWLKFGEYDAGAGLTRNIKMADYADYLVAFSLGTSGTEHMIGAMKARGKPSFVVRL